MTQMPPDAIDRTLPKGTRPNEGDAIWRGPVAGQEPNGQSAETRYVITPEGKAALAERPRFQDLTFRQLEEIGFQAWLFWRGMEAANRDVVDPAITAPLLLNGARDLLGRIAEIVGE